MTGTSHGDLWAPDRAILMAEVGSGAHGMAIEGRDDTDMMGVYMACPEHLLGLAGYEGKLVARTAAEGARSNAGDTDLTMYELRRYLALACAGNPSITMLLYVAPSMNSSWGVRLRGLRDQIVSMHTVYRFAGYLREQKARFIASTPLLDSVVPREKIPRMNRVPKRPELVERYGYDTKYASHALRLAFQGLQLATSQVLTYPMPSHQLTHVMEVKRGYVSALEALNMIEDVEAGLTNAIGRCSLRDRPNFGVVNAAAVDMYRSFWSIDTSVPGDQRPLSLQKKEPVPQGDSVSAALRAASATP